MKKTLIFVILASFFSLPAYPEATQEEMASALPKTLQHPYLFFSEADKPEILARIESDPARSELMASYIADANRLLYMPVVPVPPQPKDRGGQLFDNTDTAWITEFYNYRRWAHLLAFVYQMTGDEKYAQKSFEFARELCDMPDWVFRAHQFPVMYDRVWPWNVADDQVMFTYEIVTSDTAAMLACVYDWLYPALTREQRDWLRSGLLGNAVTRVRGNWDFHWWATSYRCNWTAWCSNGLGLASLAMLTESPQLIDMVTESHNRIYRTFNEIGIDGGWGEGASYWSHTLNKPLMFNAALARLTNGRFNLFLHPKVKDNPVNTPLYLSAPARRRVNFADASQTGLIGSRALINKLALETGNPEATWILANFHGGPSDILDLIWPDADIEPKLPEVASKHFRTIDWVVMRSDFIDPDKVMVACKAGYNDDPHHGHLDVGQLVVYWKGEAYIRDLSSARYDELNFGSKRYETPHASSIGHNLIFVNGEQQLPGRTKTTPLDPTLGGKILEFRTTPSRDYTLMDPTNAYLKNELKSWRRHIILEKPEITILLDEVESLRPGAEIEARFHSEGTQTPKDSYTLITGRSGTMALIPVAEESFSFRPGRHVYMAVLKRSEVEYIPYNGTVVNPSGTKTVLVHLIMPVNDDAEALAIAGFVTRAVDSSGNLTLSFTKSGNEYRYVFGNTRDGLVLK